VVNDDCDGNSDNGDVNNDDRGSDYNLEANLIYSDNIVVPVLCCTRIKILLKFME